MDSDQEMQDAEIPMLSSLEKGKGRAIDKETNEDNDNLPWYVGEVKRQKWCWVCIRVEKYRPVTLDDVVSHKDITSTSKLDCAVVW